MKTAAGNARVNPDSAVPNGLKGRRRGYGISDGGVKQYAGKLKLIALEDLDQRCRAATIANQLRAELESDLGGAENLNAAQRELVKRVAVLGAILGDTEAHWLTGKTADLSVLGMLIDRQRRLFETLGLHHGRKARDVTPSLGEYLNGEASP